ncbi:MFS transporter [Lysinibacter cavernae]|uniref:EmrB/QacA subfamily drug resistance transporter n=1 Tax=Lysinibacter cavernae TaxID=1640652 RepID=A0A7X5R2E3_9MICO|nr:MFS transporter [Lysinibacter cavernae]NIH54125.1 EmrB/QacA subfamily drug resistance transporter [Lysinibacter cavernae]
MSSLSTPATSASQHSGPARKLALYTLFLASFMELLDATIVNVALPEIELSLDAQGAELQWMVASYTLAFAIALITGARMGDLYGRKKLFIGGLIGFTVFSALCGLAVNPEMLIVSRGLQGFAAAAMIPQVLASIQVMYKPSERAGAVAGFSALAGIAAVSGPIVGALLTEADLFGWGWRSIFFVNIPVGLIAIVAAFKLIPESRAPERHRLDVIGVIMLGVALIAVLYPLTMGREEDWPTWTFVSIALGLALFVAFLIIQSRKERRGGSPLINLSLFRTRSFAMGLAMLALFFIPMSGFFLIQTLYLQLGLGFTILDAGLAMIPFSLTVPIFAALSATVFVKLIGRAVLQIAPVILSAGFLLLVWAGNTHGTATTWLELLPGLVVAGAGFGMVVSAIGLFVLSEVPLRFAGNASGLFNTVNQLAAAIGVAVIGTIFFGYFDSSMAESAASIRSQADAVEASSAAFRDAFEPTMIIMAITMLGASVAATFLPRRPSVADLDESLPVDELAPTDA